MQNKNIAIGELVAVNPPLEITHYLFSSNFADELSKAAATTSQWHFVQADFRGAGEQHPTRHHECDVRLRGGEEERRLPQTPGVCVAGRQLHECWLKERTDVWFQRQLPVQGKALTKQKKVRCRKVI